MKRSLKAVLAVLVALAGFGLVAPSAPAGAVPPPGPKPKAFTISAAPVSSVWSQTVKLTASLTPKGGGSPKGGTITFLADGVPVGTATATARGTTLKTAALTPGDHVITAEYSGDAVIAPATTTNGPVVSVAAAPTTITLRATKDPVPYDEPAEIKAVVLATAPAVPSRRPTGTVTFTADGCTTRTVNLNANGVATWRPWLCPGEHSIAAVYDGSEKHAASSSTAPLVVTVQDVDSEDLDQVNDGEPSSFLVIADDGEVSSAYAQTVTAGRTGRLYAVDLLGAPIPGPGDTLPGPLLVSIQTLDQDGNPTGAVLGQGQVDPGDGPGTFHVDLDTAADVEEGVAYALVLEITPQTPEAAGAWIVAATLANDYAAGDLRERIDGAAWLPHEDPDADLAFRTHVGPPV